MYNKNISSYLERKQVTISIKPIKMWRTIKFYSRKYKHFQKFPLRLSKEPRGKLPVVIKTT